MEYPEKIKQVLTDASSGQYDKSIQAIRTLLYNEGISPIDLVRQMHREILGLDISESMKMNLLDRTAEAEFRIAEGANGEVQLTALLAHIRTEQKDQ